MLLHSTCVTQASTGLLWQLEMFVADFDVTIDSRDDTMMRTLYLMRYGSKRLLRDIKRRERALKKEFRRLVRGSAECGPPNVDDACVASSPDEPVEVSESASYCGDSRATDPSKETGEVQRAPSVPEPELPPTVQQPEAIPEPNHGMLVAILFVYAVVVFVSKVVHDVFFDA